MQSAGIGFVNKVILFTNLLSPEEVGLSNLLANLSVLYAQFSALGFGNVTLKFFPYFENRGRKHHGFLGFILVVPLVGFIILSGLYLIFKPQISNYFSENSTSF